MAHIDKANVRWYSEWDVYQTLGVCARNIMMSEGLCHLSHKSFCNYAGYPYEEYFLLGFFKLIIKADRHHPLFYTSEKGMMFLKALQNAPPLPRDDSDPFAD